MADIRFNSGAGNWNGDNGAGRVVLYDASGLPMVLDDGAKPSAQRGVPVGGLNDDHFRAMRMDRSGGVAMALHQPLFHEPFDGATLNVNRWTASNSVFSPAQTTNGYSFNTTGGVAANGFAIITSLDQFLKTQRNPFYFKARASFNNIAGATAEFGFGAPAGIAIPATGAYWRIGGGVAQLFVAGNAAEFGSATISLASFANFATQYYTYDIFVDDDEAVGTIHDVNGRVVARVSVALPNGFVRAFSVSRLPTYARLFIGAAATASPPSLLLSDVYVGALDANMNRSWVDTLAAMSLVGTANPQTGAQLANWTNSTVENTAVLSNTAPSSATLGGRFAFAAVAGAATDYLLFGFTVPSPAKLFVTGIDIDVKNTGAAVATSGHELEWAAVPNLASANLAAAGGLRVPIAQHSFPIGAAIGALGGRVSADFMGMPLVTNANRVFGIALRMPVATATASQVIRGTVTIKGRFE
jgi:hypothetical protein